MVVWNKDYETYEYIHTDGYIEVFRDNIDAKRFADKNNLVFIP